MKARSKVKKIPTKHCPKSGCSGTLRKLDIKNILSNLSKYQCNKCKKLCTMDKHGIGSAYTITNSGRKINRCN